MAMGELLKDAARAFFNAHPSRLAAAISFYAAFSLAPLTILLVMLTGWYARDPGFDRYLELALKDLMGGHNAKTLLGLVTLIGQDPGATHITAFGLFSLAFGASGVFVEVQGALNTIWEAPVEESYWRSYLRQRLWTFVMLLGMAALLLLSVVAFALLTMLHNFFERHVDLPLTLLRLVHGTASFLVMTVLFAKVYKLLPDVQLWWRDVLLGGAVTSALFTLGKAVMGWYLGRFGLTSVYGPAAALVAILFWLYYSALIFLYGAHFTYVYARKYGSLAGNLQPPPKPRKKRKR
jgi:membrane protein